MSQKDMSQKDKEKELLNEKCESILKNETEILILDLMKMISRQQDEISRITDERNIMTKQHNGVINQLNLERHSYSLAMAEKDRLVAVYQLQIEELKQKINH